MIAHFSTSWPETFCVLPVWRAARIVVVFGRLKILKSGAYIQWLRRVYGLPPRVNRIGNKMSAGIDGSFCAAKRYASMTARGSPAATAAFSSLTLRTTCRASLAASAVTAGGLKIGAPLLGRTRSESAPKIGIRGAP